MAAAGGLSVRVGHFITKNVPYKVNIYLPDVANPGKPENPRTSGPELDITIPQDDTRHMKLGRFIATWSELESMAGFLLYRLLKIEVREAFLTLARLGTKNYIELIEGLGMMKLIKPDQAALSALMDRFRKLNTKRNILVHGRWVLEANVFSKRGEAILVCQFLRETMPLNPEEAKAMANPRNQKERVKYAFNFKRIDAATRDTETINRDIASFLQAMRFNAPPA
jgi:hypothetical protein